MSIRVTIVEDDAEIRKMTSSLLNLFADIECSCTFCSAEEFEKALPTLEADVVLMDIGLPGKNGIDCIKTCKNAQEMNFIMFTTHLEAQNVFDALAAGATGYILKGCNPDRLADAIREVHEGGSPMSREISRLVTSSFKRTEKLFPNLEKITTQEHEVLKGLEKGWSYREIAAQRFVSEHTVRSQVRSIYEKLEVHSRTEALNKVFGK
jgi:DNA-binding NarL/FixJ family response regulator